MEASQGGMGENRKAIVTDVQARDGLGHRAMTDASGVREDLKVNSGEVLCSSRSWLCEEMLRFPACCLGRW